jgi:hypothetical protein
MKPRNKYERRIVEELVPRLPEITEKHHQYGYDKCIPKRGAISRGSLFCLECGHKWKGLDKDWQNRIVEEKPCCPKCDQKLKMFDHNKTYHVDAGILMIVDRVKDFQVIRFIHVEKTMKKGFAPISRFAKEVTQHWIDPDGTITTMALGRVGAMGYRQESWNWSSKLSIKEPGPYDKYKYCLGENAIYPSWKVTKILRRNGFRKSFHGCDPQLLMSSLLTNPITETLLKLKQYSLLKDSVYRDSEKIKKYWSSIKICIKNGYKIGKDWIDHVELLEEFGKDLHSPKYICPENLHLDHQRLIRKKRALQRAEDLEEQVKKMKENEKNYKKMKGHLFGIVFVDKDLTVKVLDSVNDFLIEGDILEHCLFANKYYNKKDSLILSARIGDVIIETVEIDLSQMEITQIRGRNNDATKYNGRIRKLVTKNLGKIHKAHSQKFKAA